MKRDQLTPVEHVLVSAMVSAIVEELDVSRSRDNRKATDTGTAQIADTVRAVKHGDLNGQRGHYHGGTLASNCSS